MEHIGPRTPTEKKLAEIWSEILEVDSLGVHDRFAELGGQSILASRCILRVRNAFQVALPVKLFFGETGTVAELAGLIDSLREMRT